MEVLLRIFNQMKLIKLTDKEINWNIIHNHQL